MIVVGDRINSSRKEIAQAIVESDFRLIHKEAIMQVEAGADYLDINAGAFPEKETQYLCWLVERVQEVVSKPLCIDTSNPAAMASALAMHKGKALVNSITAEKARYSAILPLLKKYGASVVALCIDDVGIPDSVERCLTIADQIIESLTKEGIALHDIYIDPVVRAISADYKCGAIVLDSIEEIARRYPGVHIICGVSNISFGLPLRRQLNQIFIALAIQRGLDAALINPCDKQLVANIITATTLLGKDEYCQNYIRAFREGKFKNEK